MKKITLTLISAVLMMTVFVSTMSTAFAENEDVVPTAEAILESIYIASPPKKTEFKYGRKVSAKGLKVMAKYSDGTELDVTDEVEIRNFDSKREFSWSVGPYPARTEQKEAVVTYQGKEASFNYNVKFSLLLYIFILCTPHFLPI